MHPKITIAGLQQMKRDGEKIVAVVAYDYQLAQIVDRAGVDIVSVGDSVGVNMWGQESEGDVTVDQMLLACKAVRRGVRRAIVSCDIPSSTTDLVSAARRLVNEGGADMIKVEASVGAIRTIVDAGVAVWAQLSNPDAPVDDLVREATSLQSAGASMIDFRHSGPIAGPAAAGA